jgi:succinate-acetate transporter protein
MTRNAACRAGIMFVLLAAVFSTLSLASRIEASLVIAGIAGALCAILLVYAAAVPASLAPIPVRVRSSANRARG